MITSIEFRWFGSDLQYRVQAPPPVITAGFPLNPGVMNVNNGTLYSTTPVWGSWITVPKVERPPEQLAFNWE